MRAREAFSYATRGNACFSGQVLYTQDCKFACNTLCVFRYNPNAARPLCQRLGLICQSPCVTRRVYDKEKKERNKMRSSTWQHTSTKCIYPPPIEWR